MHSVVSQLGDVASTCLHLTEDLISVSGEPGSNQVLLELLSIPAFIPCPPAGTVAPWPILKTNSVCIVSSAVSYLPLTGSVQFISAFLRCTMSAEQIHLSVSSHLECEKEYTAEGDRGGTELSRRPGVWLL